MSILIHKDTRVLVQGITGKAGTFHTQHCREYGTKIVAGVTPGKGGELFEGSIPVYDTVSDAVKEQKIDASIIFVPALGAADCILEAIDAEIPFIVCITEGIPTNDMLQVYERLKDSKSLLLGPNCPGIVTPGECKMGIMPSYILKKGKVGVVSRSGTLSFEVVYQLTQKGIGQSTCVGIGGDPVHGLTFTDVIKRFNDDPETEGIIMVGEIGGEEEILAAEYIQQHVRKPVAAFIAGVTAPAGRRMGHAGAIISGKSSSAKYKIEALQKAGIAVALDPSKIADTYKSIAG